MTASENKINYIREYNEKMYEKLTLMLKPGTKERWREYAENKGVSLTALIVDCVDGRYLGGEDNA